MEDAHFTETETSKASEVKCENDPQCFYFSEVREIMHREFIPPGQNVNQEYYLGDFEAIEREFAKKTPRICGDRVIGFSIMTTPQLTQLCL